MQAVFALNSLLTGLSLLNELDDDLMLELDVVVRQNQLACLPIAKSGRAENDLIKKHPQLLDLMARSKGIKIDVIYLQNRSHEREAKFSGNSKAKAAFFEDSVQSPSLPNSGLRTSQDRTSQSKSPSLRAKSSAADLMFEMEEDSEPEAETVDRSTPDRRRRHKANTPDSLLPPPRMTMDDETGDGRTSSSLRADGAIAASTSPSSYRSQGFSTSKSPGDIHNKQPWAPPAMTAGRLDMKDIMAQASTSTDRVSNISTGLSLRARESEASSSGLPTKLSQKERKRQQQHQQLRPAQSFPPTSIEPQVQGKASASPWQVTSSSSKISLKDVLGAESTVSPLSEAKSIPRTPSPLTMRQTVSGKAPSARKTTSDPGSAQAPTQKRSISTSDTSKSTGQTIPIPSRSSSSQHPIRSVRHNPPAVEPTLQLSMSDILNQQQTEKDIIKEAAAKRSLQEIQEEQAFQEWWDEESRKVREQQEQAARPASSRGRGGRGGRGKVRAGSRGRGRGRGRGAGAGDGDGDSGVGGGKKVARGPSM